MKYIKNLIVFFIMACAQLHSTYSVAQPRTFSMAHDYLTINNVTVSVKDFCTIDSMDANNNKVYTASFEIELRGGQEVKAILQDIELASESGKNIQLIFSKVNTQLTIIEERDYAEASVQGMALSAVDASSKEAVGFKVKIKSDKMNIVSDKGGKFTAATSQRTKSVLNSSFRFEMDAAGVKSVSKISLLNLGPGNNEYQQFAIDVSAADIKTFNEWFANDKGEKNKKQGKIIFSEPNLKTEVMSIDLPDLEIIFLTNCNNNQETVAKTVVGLRTKNPSIGK